jgi:cardiolipin synthase
MASIVFAIVVVAAIWPRVIAWPLAFIGAWLAMSWLLKSWSLLRRAKHAREPEMAPAPRPTEAAEKDGGAG